AKSASGIGIATNSTASTKPCLPAAGCASPGPRPTAPMRSVDLVRYAGGQQPDGCHFLRLRELRLELDALGNVIHDQDAADHAEIARQERSNGDVGNARV